MRVNRFDIPEYRVAVERENAIRDAAFLDCEANICGVNIRQMTPLDFAILDGLENVFVSGGMPDGKQVATFLWVMLPRRWRGLRAVWFGLRCRRLPFYAAVAQIKQFVEDTFQDSPGSSGGGGVPHIGYIASLVHELASVYNWPESQIVNMPFKRVYQYVKIIRATEQAKRGQKPVMFNPSDKVIGKILRERNGVNHG